MRLLAAVALFGLSPALCFAATHGSEGRLETTAPDPNRQSSYRSDQLASAPPAAGKLHRNPDFASSKKSAAGILRDRTVTMANKAGYFDFYDASRTLRLDRDADGYHSEFRIGFDADVTFGDALVYARLYLRRVGDVDWTLYRTTDDFWLYGQSGSDNYFVDTSLDDGFPTGEYDVLIDLYEVGYTGIVATIGPMDDGALRDLPLEESGLDAAFGLDGFFINTVTTTLLADNDGDGFHSAFRIAFDPDTDFGPSMAYAVVWVRARGGDWIEEHVTDDFLIDASGTADTYSFTADWISGYPTGDYDVQIDLHDASTSLLIASAGSERAELSRVPLEDRSRDTVASVPPPTTVVTTTSSYERTSGGGALSLWWVAGLIALLVAARWHRLIAARRTVLLTARQRARERSGLNR